MLAADHVIFATGYRADLARYITGSRPPATSGPFHGFTAGCASAARITVTEMMT
jgi:hypothetical protein